MRIAVVAPLVAPLRSADARGNHAVLLDVARGLAGRGHQVTLHGAAGSRAPGLEVVPVPVDAIVRRGFVVPGRPATAPDDEVDLAMARAFERLVRDVLDRAPDAVSQHAFDAPAIELTEDLPVVHTLHLPPIVPAVVAAVRRTRRPVAAVSGASRTAWLAAGVGEVGLLRNGVPDLLGPRTADAALGRAPDRVALIAGRVSPEKGTATAVRVARAAGLRPLVVGPAYDAAYAREQVEPLVSTFEWRPAVSRRALARLMARAAVVLMPIGWEEPFGLVAAEAQLVGCPVVGYRRGALPEVVEDGVGGLLVEPDDEEALVEAVGRALLLDRRAVRARALPRLGIEAMLDAYEAALGAP
ncbi:MAG TPA: glycosyltransferase [Candidatus Limnocylindrales bacterium]